MTSKKNPDINKKPNKDEGSDSQTYLAIGVLFFVLGVSMLLTETSRAVGIPFAVLGFTFLILSQDKNSGPKKK